AVRGDARRAARAPVRAVRHPGGGAGMRGRPLLRTAYGQDLALLDTASKRGAVGALVLVGLALPWLLTDEILQLLATCCVAAIGAIGLNLVTGYAGQVSLGHAFFLAIGPYTAA